MRIAILGPTGGTGQQLVTQALDRGHEVVAVARRTGAVKAQHPRLRVVYGDVFDKPSLVSALAGADAAIFAVGVASIWQARKPTTVYSAGGGNLMQAASEAGVGRVVLISSSGTDPKPGDPWWFTSIVKPLFLQRMYDDMRRMEQLVTGSATPWTIVRPPQLIDGAWTGVYRTARNGVIPNDGDLSRGDLAHFILDELEHAAYLNAKVDVSY